jgi:hypothetical protein
MLQGCRDPRLTLETVERYRIGVRIQQYLHCDIAAEYRVASSPDLAHTAASEWLI